VVGAKVTVEAPELCPRFTLRGFEDVTIAPSPPWLAARLMAAGQRPISNVVDITNYVMLVTGQPLHAFDWDRVEGGSLVVRRAGDGEQVETLDGVLRRLDSDMVVICDDAGPTSIAGIMGGGRSEVSDGTTRVLMEAATWVGANIQRSSTRLGLRSEASARFEKQLSPEAALEAQALATRLMVELCGAKVVPGTIDAGGAPPAGAPIRLRDARLERLLGERIPRERSTDILTALGFGVVDAEDGLDVTVPHFRRNDVTREADLIEEVARIDGLERLPATLPPRRAASGRLTFAQRMRRRAEDALAGAGLHEIAGWSFTAPDLPDRLRLPAGDERRRLVTLRNPLSEDQSAMRTTLLGSLLDAARHNAARGADDVRLFESGAVYLARDDEGDGAGALPEERQRIAALLTGAARPATWREESPVRADVFAAKGVLAALLGALRVEWEVEAFAEPFLHPGRAAAVLAGGERAGWLGELHPAVAEAWDLPSAAAFELDLGIVLAHATEVPRYRDVTSFPEVRQDIAVVVADDVAAARVLAVVRAAGGPELVRAEVFDVFRGESIGEGRVSLALHLAFRAPDRTLTDADAAERREAIVAALAGELGATLRA
jgi:phenylalanyl-tRNA synthetase beta chain